MSTTDHSPALIEDKQVARQAVRDTSVVGIPQNLQEVVEIAKVMAASGFYADVNTAQKAAAIMLLGIQYGIPPAQALTSIHVVKGKPMLHYSALLSKVRQHPDYDYHIAESTAKRAEVHFIRRGEVCGISVFTDVDAKRQGTQNMEKFPDTMLLARAVSNGIKRYCPDVVNGMPVYTPGEIEENDAVYSPTPAATKGDALRAEMKAKAVLPEPSAADKDTGEVLPDEPEQLKADLCMNDDQWTFVEDELSRIPGAEGSSIAAALDFLKSCRTDGAKSWEEVSRRLTAYVDSKTGQGTLV